MKPYEPLPWRYLLAWYATSLCFFLLLPTWKFGLPLWQLPHSDLRAFSCLALAFLFSAGIGCLFRHTEHGRALWLTALFTTASFGLVFLGFLGARTEFSRIATIIAFAYAIVLVPVPYVMGASRTYWAVAFVALLAAGLVLPFVPTSPPLPKHSSLVIKTEYYNLDVETDRGLFPRSVLGGGLARIGDSYLRLSGDGQLYLFGWENQANELAVKPLPYPVPINGEEFAAAAGHPWETSTNEGVQESKVDLDHQGLHPEWFRTYGLLAQEVGSRLRLFVTHDYWKPAQECYVERVSMLEAERATILGGAVGPKWRTLYETAPCLPIRGEGSRRGVSFVGYFGGGRMALLDPQTLLLTVGEFGFDGVSSNEVLSQDPGNSYGKTLTINITDGRATLFTLGHRNPEGLFIDQSGTIWSTEHGPQGGDELNQLVRGKNYGWPFATDGTDYGAFSWPLLKPETAQAFQTPLFAWVPSIGISSLLVVQDELFPQWRGDLLIGSLKAQTLFRARIRDGHVAYLESIELGIRIRDLVEGHDGRIIIVTDGDSLVTIRPKQGHSGEALFAEKCSGCHRSSSTSRQTIGPNLFGVVGRRIASQSDQIYSPAFRQLGGDWTEERLDRFLTAPREFIPGTAMDYAGLADAAERSAIISYLRTQR
jgi:aldose sugar dehydrogenase